MGSTRPTTPVPLSIGRISARTAQAFCAAQRASSPSRPSTRGMKLTVSPAACAVSIRLPAAAPILIPVVEGIDLAQSDETQARAPSRPRAPARCSLGADRPRSFLGHADSHARRGREDASHFGTVFWFSAKSMAAFASDAWLGRRFMITRPLGRVRRATFVGDLP